MEKGNRTQRAITLENIEWEAHTSDTRGVSKGKGRITIFFDVSKLEASFLKSLSAMYEDVGLDEAQRVAMVASMQRHMDVNLVLSHIQKSQG